jgi:exopolyphosphatase/guanosine-5'-triphosphate,3'-diphosphate pyrophosphatase
VAKRTAIIDIGSNSISLVVYEKSSRYAFHLIEKIRSKVRIGEGAYENGGHLGDEAMQRAYDTLKDFLSVIKSLGCKKVLTVATSALRDAPNKKDFLSKVSKELNLNIKIIDGKKEAYLGAIAVINLLPKIDYAITIDIGGGSTELARIEKGDVKETISLNIGTVRLKELFVDKKKDFSHIQTYINSVFKDIPDNFKTANIIGIGGTIRTLSTAILKDSNYPVDSLHAYEYEYKECEDFIKNISKCEVRELKELYIAKSRYDTIREGSTIFFMLCEKLEAKNVITSKAGVREGVYLSDILRGSNHKFPVNFNISIKSLIDRFAIYRKNISYMGRVATDIYLQTNQFFDKDENFKDDLLKASKLLLIMRRLNIYSNSDMSFYFLVENLNFAISHKQKILIALILKFAHKKDIDEKEIESFGELLPPVEVVRWLSFILSLTLCINKNKKIQKIDIEYKDKKLSIKSADKMFLSIACIKKLKKPASFAIDLKPSS